MQEEVKLTRYFRRALMGLCCVLALAIALIVAKRKYQENIPVYVHISKVPSAAREKQIEQAMKRIGDAWLRCKPTAKELAATRLGVYGVKDSLACRKVQQCHLDHDICENYDAKNYSSRYVLLCRDFVQQINTHYHNGRTVGITRGFWLAYDTQTRSVLHIPVSQVHLTEGQIGMYVFPNDPHYASLYARTTNGSTPGVNIVQ